MSIQNIRFKRKISIYSICFFLCIVSIANFIPLKAASWGANKEIFEFQGSEWREAYLKLDGLNCTALIPNYSGASLSDGSVSVKGSINEEFGYLISTSWNGNFTPPKNKQKFLNLIQEANKSHTAKLINAKKFGVTYAVELVPINEENSYWLFFSTDNRIIQMGTDDSDADRRNYFFNSFKNY